MSSNEIPVVGVDDGYAQIKVVAKHGKGPALAEWVYPARANTGVESMTFDSDLSLSYYTTQGAQFTVGCTEAADTRFENYPVSDLNRVLVAHALVKSGFNSGGEIRVVSGLPIERYYQGTTKNQQLIEAKTRSLMIPVHDSKGEVAVRVVRHTVLPQAIAAWFDYAIDEAGTLREGVLDDSIGVVDIGGRTTDVAVVQPNHVLDMTRTGTDVVGVLSIFDKVRKAICVRFGISSISRHELDHAIREHRYRLKGEWHDISDIIESNAREIGQRIAYAVQARIGEGNDLGRVLVVAGGAALFAEELRSYYPHAHVPVNPECANARGYAKYALYVE